MIKSKSEELIFDVLLLLIAGTAVVMSFSYNPTARVFPLYFGLVAFLFVLLNLIVASMKNPPKYLRFIKQQGAFSRINGTTNEDQKADGNISWKLISKIVLWLIGYLIALAAINYLTATFVFLTLFLRIAGDVQWIKTFFISLIFTGCLYVLFEVIL